MFHFWLHYLTLEKLFGGFILKKLTLCTTERTRLPAFQFTLNAVTWQQNARAERLQMIIESCVISMKCSWSGFFPNSWSGTTCGVTFVTNLSDSHSCPLKQIWAMQRNWLFVSPELSSVRDYVITHSVRSMYVCMCMYVYVCMCMYVVICKIDHCIHIHWCIVMGLGHNDPWVESHMWPQQTWGQRSSRGQWPLVQIFCKKGSVYPHTLMYFQI